MLSIKVSVVLDLTLWVFKEVLMQLTYFFDAYKKASVVIGMRGHSVICGVGLNTPTIALSSHSKVKGFMNMVGLSDRVIDMADPNFVNLLDRMVCEILDNRLDEVPRLKIVQKKCREKTRVFNQRILALLTKEPLIHSGSDG